MDNKYLVFTRKWRPKTCDEIIGQEQVVTPLKRAIDLNRIMHAYLFSGPRGVGKTTTARVLAKALNCEKGPVTTPCSECVVCKEIAAGNSLDVIEIDGASNRGIDEIRELREHVGFSANKGRYKIYIIDEVHMLTKEAFNALLKTLEEPPKHVIFVFATTNPQKIPQTILSRCQHFRFKRIPVSIIVENLKMIAKNEKLEYEEEALFIVAKAADGALRDGQRIFDQAVTYVKGGKMTANLVSEMLGEIDVDVLNGIMEAIIKKDLKKAIESIESIFDAGFDLKHFLNDFIEMLRNMLIIKSVDLKDVVNLGEEEYNYLKQLSGEIGRERILFILHKAIDTEQLIEKTNIPNIILEVLIMDVMLLEGDVKVKAVYAGESAGAGKVVIDEEAITKAIEKKEEKKPAAMIIESIEEEKEIKILTKEIIERHWDNIIERAGNKKGNVEVAQCLETAGIVSFEDINLFITGGSHFATKMLRDNIDFIKELLKEEFKKELKLIIYDKEEYKKKYQVKKEVLEEEAKNQQVVKDLSKVFEFTDIKVKKNK